MLSCKPRLFENLLKNHCEIQKKRSYYFSERGFTLLELLIVITITGIIASIVTPSFLKYVRGCFLNQESCINRDPIYKSCHKDAKTKDEGSSGEILIQLRYSAKCHMTWPRVLAQKSSQISGAQIYVLDEKQNRYGLSTVRRGYNNYYGDMGPGYALGACAILANSQTICTDGLTIMLLSD